MKTADNHRFRQQTSDLTGRRYVIFFGHDTLSHCSFSLRPQISKACAFWNSRAFPAAEIKKGQEPEEVACPKFEGTQPGIRDRRRKSSLKKKKGSRNPNPLPPLQEVCLTMTSYARSFSNVSSKTMPLCVMHPPFSGWFEPLRIPGFSSLGFPG